LSVAVAAPRRTLVGSFVRWAITGCLAAGTDLGLLALLHSAAGVPLELATALAFCCGVAVNYSLNHSWSFQSQAAHRRVMVRYAVMVVFNGVSTVLIVAGLHSLGLYYLLAKLVAIAVNAVVNFTAARFWVFAE
jgi:putative flippase GtrA